MMLKKVGILKGLGMAKFLLGPKGAIIATALEAIGTAAAVGGLAGMLGGGGATTLGFVIVLTLLSFYSMKGSILKLKEPL